MTNIQRKDFKYNFLKNIIIRFDFQGVFEPELENILPDIKPYLKEKNFTRYNKRNDNTINININDMQPPIFNNFQNQIIHSFVNDDSGYRLDISNNFICLNIRSTTYSPFEEYAKLISDIIKIYKEKIDFFTITRIGIRKINECMVKDKNLINKFFSENYFKCFSSDKTINTFSSEKKDSFEIDEKDRGNISCKIVQGKADNITLYQLTLDIDIYRDNTKKINSINDYQIELQKMNNIIFDIFINALTDNLKSALMNDSYFEFEKDLLGVEKND